jgi:hypothetical protein
VEKQIILLIIAISLHFNIDILEKAVFALLEIKQLEKGKYSQFNIGKAAWKI